jgi:hypothetical protein
MHLEGKQWSALARKTGQALVTFHARLGFQGQIFGLSFRGACPANPRTIPQGASLGPSLAWWGNVTGRYTGGTFLWFIFKPNTYRENVEGEPYKGPMKIPQFLAALIPVALCAGLGHAIHNPIIPGWNPDPAILRVGNEYFIATSSMEYWPGIPIYRSTDLEEWELYSHALTRPEQLQLYGTPTSAGMTSIKHFLCYF